MATVPIPQGATITPLQATAVPIPRGATLEPITQTLNADQPGMQAGPNHFDPVESFGQGLKKSKEAIPNFVDLVRDAIEHPENHQSVHNAKGLVAKSKAILSLNNPLPPDEGQGMGNRVAEGAGNFVGQGIQGEAVTGSPTLGDAADALKATPGKLRAASQAAIEGAKNVSPAVKAVAKLAPDAVGMAYPPAAHAMSFARGTFKIFKTLTDNFSPAEYTKAPAPAPVDTSVPASSLSMTQFPPKLAADSMAKLSGTQATSTAEMMGVPKPVVSEVQSVMSEAAAKAKDIITKTEQQYPKKGTFADVLDDAAFSQEANWDLEKHWYRELSAERQKFFADNAPTFNKGQLVARQQVNQIFQEATLKAGKILDEAKLSSETRTKLLSSIAAPDASAAPLGGKVKAPITGQVDPYEDMTGILEESLKAARNKKGK